MSDKIIDVKEKYEYELSKINDLLTQLENNQVYDLLGTKSDGYLSTNAQKLKKMIFQLVAKIENQKPSAGELDDSLFNSKED